MISFPQPLQQRHQVTLTLLVLLMAASSFVPVRLVAQTDAPEVGLVVDEAMLRLWPEYDDPGLLVIYSGVLNGDAVFPQEVAFPLPSDAYGIQATYQDTSGSLLTQPWQQADGELVYTLPGPAFHIEYYLPRPSSGNQRELAYTFQSSYAVRRLQIEVLQPARATGFAVDPQPAGSIAGPSGLVVYQLSRENLAVGENLPVSIRYQKPDNDPSVAPVVPASGAANDAPASATGVPVVSSAVDLLPWVLIGLGVLTLLGAGLYWLMQQRREHLPALEPGAVQRNHTPRARAAAGDEPVFCARCGRRFGAEDQFCAQCGAPRRRGTRA